MDLNVAISEMEKLVNESSDLENPNPFFIKKEDSFGKIANTISFFEKHNSKISKNNKFFEKFKTLAEKLNSCEKTVCNSNSVQEALVALSNYFINRLSETAIDDDQIKKIIFESKLVNLLSQFERGQSKVCEMLRLRGLDLFITFKKRKEHIMVFFCSCC